MFLYTFSWLTGINNTREVEISLEFRFLTTGIGMDYRNTAHYKCV